MAFEGSVTMGAYKKLDGRYLYVDMSEIHVPSWKIREVQKAAHAKTRALKKIDPFARCVGSKLKFQDPEELRVLCENYFKEQEYFVRDKWGKPLRDPDTGAFVKSTKPLSIAGLGRYIGCATSTLRRYKAVAESGTIPYEYAEIVNDALQRIEEYAECRGYDRDGQRGAQFVLQAGFGWNTKKEERECRRLSAETEATKEKLKMQKEKHQLEMKLLQAGLDEGEDNNIQITITRANKNND